MLLVKPSFSDEIDKPKLLVKFPTRERPVKFFEVLDQYYKLLSGYYEYEFIITCDSDDSSMNNPAVLAKLSSYPNLSYSFINRTNKIHSYNRDMDGRDFDVLIVASDDMLPVMNDYDVYIFKLIKESNLGFDCIINSYDGFIGSELNTIPIIGRKFYDRFGYIYNPIYSSVGCDLELTQISKILKREICSDACIFKHEHPCYGYADDNLYKHNNNASLQEADTYTFRKRKALYFGMNETDPDSLPTTLDIFGKPPQDTMWTIMIPTLVGRESTFTDLYLKILDQIIRNGLYKEVDIIFFKDNRKYNVGFKRNKLLEQARGKYVSFVDDDDMVSDDYVKLIYRALLKNPDCVSLIGLITFDGKNPKRFYHSIKYDSFFERGNIYYRPPNHLNPIRKSIAAQFKFPEINFGEDSDWAMQICRSKLLKSEEVIKTVYYYYLFKSEGH